MSFSAAGPLQRPFHGTLAQAVAYTDKWGGQLGDFSIESVAELYRLRVKVGLDFGLAIEPPPCERCQPEPVATGV